VPTPDETLVDLNGNAVIHRPFGRLPDEVRGNFAQDRQAAPPIVDAEKIFRHSPEHDFDFGFGHRTVRPRAGRTAANLPPK